MKKINRLLFVLCISVFSVLMTAMTVSADTLCSSKSDVQKEFSEQISVPGTSELVVMTDRKMETDDLLDAFDEAAISNGRIYNEKITLSIIQRGSTYTYKIPVDPANFVKLSVYRSEKKLYAACLKALYECDFDKRFYNGDSGCYDTMFLVLKQHPEFNYAIYATRYKSLSGKVFCGFKVSDSFSESKIASMMKDTEKKADAVIKSVITAGMTNKQKVTALHKYVVENCCYSSNITQKSATAYGCLVEGNAVCQGYAAAMNILLAKCGIYSIAVAGDTISGSDEGHAWNYVKCGGLSYLDATWDDPVPDRGTNILTDYLFADESFMKKTHIWDKTEYSEKYIKYSKSFFKTVY